MARISEVEGSPRLRCQQFVVSDDEAEQLAMIAKSEGISKSKLVWIAMREVFKSYSGLYGRTKKNVLVKAKYKNIGVRSLKTIPESEGKALELRISDAIKAEIASKRSRRKK